jgi:hypothetical protein
LTIPACALIALVAGCLETRGIGARWPPLREYKGGGRREEGGEKREGGKWGGGRREEEGRRRKEEAGRIRAYVAITGCRIRFLYVHAITV